MRATDLTEYVSFDGHSRWAHPSANATMCVAAARKTGLPLVMFQVDGIPCHAAVLLPTGRWVDHEGEHRRGSYPIVCDPDCSIEEIEIAPASEEDLDRAFTVQFSAIWEADVYMKFHDELREIVEQYGGDFRYHFD